MCYGMCLVTDSAVMLDGGLFLFYLSREGNVSRVIFNHQKEFHFQCALSEFIVTDTKYTLSLFYCCCISHMSSMR